MTICTDKQGVVWFRFPCSNKNMEKIIIILAYPNALYNKKNRPLSGG